MFPLNNQEKTFQCLHYYVQASFVIRNVERGIFFARLGMTILHKLSSRRHMIIILHKLEDDLIFGEKGEDDLFSVQAFYMHQWYKLRKLLYSQKGLF